MLPELKNLNEHIEKFAAAFIKETGLDASKVVMVQQDIWSKEAKIWFRAKTEKEIELDKRSETTIEQLRFCPECPCEFCKAKRKD
jgi:hypothetical protein